MTTAPFCALAVTALLCFWNIMAESTVLCFPTTNFVLTIQTFSSVKTIPITSPSQGNEALAGMNNHKKSSASQTDHNLVHGTEEQENTHNLRTRNRAAAATHSITPHPMDILSGRGKRSYNHPGNKRMREIIGRYQPLHLEARSSNNPKDPRRATALTSALSEILETKDGLQPRFLKFDESTNGWVLLSESKIREKVKHRLRSTKRKKENVNSSPASRDQELAEVTEHRTSPDESSKSSRKPCGSDNSVNGEYNEECKSHGSIDHIEDLNLLMPLDLNDGVNESQLQEIFPEQNQASSNNEEEGPML